MRGGNSNSRTTARAVAASGGYYVSMCADAASLQEPMRTGAAQGVVFVGLHAAADPGPHPDIHLFANISQDPVAIGKATADYATTTTGGLTVARSLAHVRYNYETTPFLYLELDGRRDYPAGGRPGGRGRGVERPTARRRDGASPDLLPPHQRPRPRQPLPPA